MGVACTYALGCITVVVKWVWEFLGLTFIGLQEYGTGRYNKKHSTFFATMMRELGLNEENEFYFDLVPWQSLASMNHNFLLTERRRHYLRYAGGLTFFEVCTFLVSDCWGMSCSSYIAIVYIQCCCGHC